MKRVIILKLIVIFLFISLFMIACSKKEKEQNRRVSVVKNEKDDDFANENRLALIIGNSRYKVGLLRNPVNDARAMAEKLENLDFSVMLEENKTQDEMKRAILKFGKSLKKSGGVGLFYFGGHGMQVKGKNYLIPIDTKFESEEDVEILAVDVGMVLNRMENAKNRVNIIILDACRNNPFIRGTRSGARGLAAIDAPGGTIIAYSTAPGSIAEDGAGENSTFTKYLLGNIGLPGLRIEDVFKNVRKKVMEETKNRQIPWESSSLVGDFYFAYPISTISEDKPTQPITLQQKKPSRHEQETSLELTFWKSIEKSTNPEDFKDYLQRFPGGTFTGIAKRLLDSLIKKRKQISEKKDTTVDEAHSVKKEAYYSIQVGAFQLYATAKPYAERFSRAGYPTEIIAAQMRNKPVLYQVRVGNFKDLATARSEKDKLEKIEGKRFQIVKSHQNSSESKVSEAKKEINEMSDLHSYVRKVKEKSRRVYKNSKGYWEAEFEHDIVMIYIPVGEFIMGSPESEKNREYEKDGYCSEGPVHTVYLDGYWIGKYEVTFDQYDFFSYDTGRSKLPDEGWGRGNRPVINVCWYDAVSFCQWFARKTGLNFHLPTEAQWEKACRAGTRTPFYFGNSLNSYQANFNGNYPYGGASKGPYLEKTTPVGNYSTNGFGIYDMHGNVYEWCSDWYKAEFYIHSPYKNPDGPASGNSRVYRGGSWEWPGFVLRSAYRNYGNPPSSSNDKGFRLALD